MRPNRPPDPDRTSLPHPTDEAERAPRRYVSFVLRCRTTPAGDVRAQLSEVHSGVTRTVADLDDLPDLIRRWIEGRQSGISQDEEEA